MMLLAVLAYFALATLSAALWLLPDFRARLLGVLGRNATRLRSGSRQAAAATAGGLQQALSAGGRELQHGASAAKKHRWPLLIALLLLTTGPLLTYLLRHQLRLEGYAEEVRPPNAQIATLLAGERLVAPAPLPPEVFSTVEAEQVRPLLSSADRRWALLDADFTQRLLAVFKLMREQHGYEMALLEGYRSPERQDLLASLGGNVTNARAYQSWHQFGLAADCAFYREGKLVISEKDPWAMRGYQLFGETAEALGLRWGGRWKLQDYGHTELPRPGLIKR